MSFANNLFGKEYSLHHPSGNPFSFSSLRENPLTLLIFIKSTCHTCIFLLPYLSEYLHRQSGGTGSMLLVSQDTRDETLKFARAIDPTMPLVVDHPVYSLSRVLEFKTVPALFLLDSQGSILEMSEGFVRAEIEEMMKRLEQENQLPQLPLFPANEDIPRLKPG